MKRNYNYYRLYGKRGVNLNLKYFGFGMIVILSLLLSACNNAVEPKEHLGEIYSVTLDSIMEQDNSLNDHMKFIAIDMSNFKDVDDSDKEEIVKYIKDKYNVEVMDATFEQLEEKGLFNSDTMVLDGVLLKVELIDFKSNNQIPFIGSKYRSAKGAIGVEGKVHYKDNGWRPKDVEIISIS